MSTQSTIIWLKTASVFTALTGVPFVLNTIPGLSQIANLFVDNAFFPIDGKQAISTPEARFLSAIAGGVTIGLATMIWMLADKLYAREPAVTRQIILTGLGCWFVADSLGSVLAGAPFNVLPNLLIMGMFYWPLRNAAPDT